MNIAILFHIIYNHIVTLFYCSFGLFESDYLFILFVGIQQCRSCQVIPFYGFIVLVLHGVFNTCWLLNGICIRFIIFAKEFDRDLGFPSSF